MDWAAWSASLDRILHSPNFSMWATVAVAAFVALLVMITLLRADKSVANGALVVITLGAIGLAGYIVFRTPSTTVTGATMVALDGSGPTAKAMPALACVDDLAGDLVLSACEKALFSSPETVAAAVSYAAAQLGRLTALGDVAAADKRMTPQLARLRRAVERDRYGLIAYVLASQDRCQTSDCPAFRSLTDTTRIVANMGDHLYETTLTRYAPSWGMPTAASAATATTSTAVVPGPAPTPGLAGVTEAPSGKPTDIDFPTSASIPPVSIMTPEPGPAGAAPAKPAAAAGHGAAANAKAAPSAPAKRPPAAAQASANHNGGGAAAANPPPAKRPPAPPRPKPAAPVQLAPEAANSDN
ncbi:hypothetical protein BJ123_112115 [Rhodopseudomonas thermotolerans]|uniref:Uncharacterized protein n=2 Tax=Rhodopseudomonas TaxID=1073 RepID=A0A336JV34_9BRAD|nr:MULTISPECIES: hypothetical protein [Rhodopseudomonas]RED32639.1 hypothetical protein BJ125_112116 [Rhodopseudomonas pentothenatexigens]REF93648.1 hypothetical protein BJ123_112115 [Rhodopseudomonas thermotolerans]SSW91534.1 hypothetical protein SAMN05892882_112116 [Rhodopseudomonas pentothenatexigens]